MQFESTKTAGDISINDVGRAVFKFLRWEVVMKAAFIVFSAGLLTMIVTHTQTSYTPTVDVFVYSLVYSSWITTCLPWLVQNMNGKLLGMLIGVVFRLFAVDVGVLVWSAIRGHRSILQRGLRMKPLFEPSMSWLSEAGYNLRYGVIVSAVVASAISLMIDYYDKLSEESNIRKRSTVPKRDNTNMTTDALNTCDAVYYNRNPFHQHHGQELVNQESKISKFAPRSHFETNDGYDLNPLSNVGLGNNSTREYNDSNGWLTTSASDTGCHDDNFHKEMHDLDKCVFHKNNKPIIIQSSRSSFNESGNIRSSNNFETSDLRPGTDIPDACRLRLNNLDRIDDGEEGRLDGDVDRLDGDKGRLDAEGLDEIASMFVGQIKGKSGSRRAESASPIEAYRVKPNVPHLRERCARRDHINNLAAKNETTQKRRRGTVQTAMVDALNESFHGLRKLRGKI